MDIEVTDVVAYVRVNGTEYEVELSKYNNGEYRLIINDKEVGWEDELPADLREAIREALE